MFATLSLKELKLLIRELRDHHSIKNYSKMKKADLVAALAERFVLRDNNLYLKEDTRPKKEPKPEPKPEKDMRLIPKDAGVKIGKNRYATTQPIPGKPSAKL